MRSEHYVEEIFLLVGSATACWDEDGIFKEQDAIKIADRLCEIVREQSAPKLSARPVRRRSK